MYMMNTWHQDLVDLYMPEKKTPGNLILKVFRYAMEIHFQGFPGDYFELESYISKS